jgi:hypothetical protein
MFGVDWLTIQGDLIVEQCKTDTTVTGAAGASGGGAPPKIGAIAFGFKDGTWNNGEAVFLVAGVEMETTGAAAGKAAS